MNFDDMSSFLSAQGAQNQSLTYRIKKRTLESRERKLLGTLSLAYGFDVFVLMGSALSLLTELDMAHPSILVLIAVSIAVSLFLAYVIFRVWRNPAPPSVLVVVPAGVLLALSLPSISLVLLIPNLIAFIAGISLGKTWADLSALAASMDTSPD